MTIIAFDGRYLVADGASTVRSPRAKPIMNKYHVNKIVIPEFNWYDERSKVTIKAIAGTGTTKDIEDIIIELLHAGRSGIDMGDKMLSLQNLLDNRTNCQIVYVGLENKNGKQVPVANNLIRTGEMKLRRFKISGDFPAIAGAINDIPNWKLKEGWNNALDIVSLICTLKQDGVAGMISRYDIQTGKLDHPKLIPAVRLNKMLAKFEKEELEKLKDKYNKAREFVKNPVNSY